MEINKENLLKLYELELDKLIEISNSITKETDISGNCDYIYSGSLYKCKSALY